MRALNNLSIKTRAMIAFGLMIVLSCALSFASFTLIRATNDATVDIATNWLPSLNVGQEMKFWNAQTRAGTARAILSSNDADRAKGLDSVKTRRAKLQELINHYEKDLVMSDQDRANLAEVRKTVDEYGKITDSLVAAVVAGDKAGAGEQFVDASPVFEASTNALDKMNTYNIEGSDGAVAAAGRNYQTAIYVMIGATVLALIVAISSLLMITSTVVTPIGQMTDSMQKVADGNLALTIEGTDRGDEVGAAARTLEFFRKKLIEARDLAAAQDAERKAKEARAEKIAARTKSFDNVVRLSLTTVSSASKQMEGSAASMQAAAEETNVQSSAVAAASEQASANVQTVAAATEELAGSIKEIGRQVTQSSEVTAKAVEEANKAKDLIRGLDEAAQQIGKVVALITDIAEQTNLLALNATIEAARAGEAGKGFAVVASEVKNLANQTAKATEEISSQIEGVQGATKSSVTAIESIFGTIGQINQISTTIAAAIEEQTAATAEISRNVEQAAVGTKEVSTNIVGVTQAAGETGQVSLQVLEAAKSLNAQSDSLRTEVDGFLRDIQEAA
jgi:methyl-accepting chemotaxis protein